MNPDAWKSWLGFGGAVTVIGLGRILILHLFGKGQVSHIYYMLALGIIMLAVGLFLLLRRGKK